MEFLAGYAGRWDMCLSRERGQLLLDKVEGVQTGGKNLQIAFCSLCSFCGSGS
jgi:hypothetical protein